jgi:hypothetical protein
MAITSAICTVFKKHLLEAVHDFRNAGGDTFKLALYSSAATLDSTTTAYTATNEIPASGGYSAGGSNLTRVDPTSSGAVAYTDFADLVWAASTITNARGCMIYNSTPTHTYTNPAILVADFGSDKSTAGGDFTIVFPTADATNAVIRLV